MSVQSSRSLRSDWIADEVPGPVKLSDETWDVTGAPTRDLQILDLKGLGRLHRNPQSVRRRFAELRNLWRGETKFDPSLMHKFMHPAYQEIIGLGPQVVELLVDDLRIAPQHWFWALRAIVGKDHAAGVQNMRDAAQCWIDWYDSGARQ